MYDHNHNYNQGFVRDRNRNTGEIIVSVMTAITISAVAACEIVKLIEDKLRKY